MPDNNESRRLGESWQAYNDRLRLQDTWHFNQRVALAQKEKTDALIKAAQDGLKAAIEADKRAGLAETAALRTQRPFRDPILDVVPDWSWSPEKRAEFDSKRRIAERAFFEGIIAAEPRLLSDADRKFLPSAILFFQREQAALEN